MTKNNSWDNLAEKYHKSVGTTGDIYHKTYLNPLILKLLGNVKNKKILDLACGNGYFSKLLSKKQALITGVDYSKKLIAIAKNKNSIKGKTDFFVVTSANLAFLKNNSYDFIVSNMAFQDIKNIQKTIKECSRLLKAKAVVKSKLIFSIPHPVFHSSEVIKVNNEYFKKVKNYMSLLTLDHLCYEGVKHYHRPIEYYLKLLFKNNFVVSGFYEITTKHARGERIKNSRLLEHKKEIPSFLIIEATFTK